MSHLHLPGLLVGRGERMTVDANFPGCRFKKAHHQVEQRRFSAASFADKADPRTLWNSKADVVERETSVGRISEADRVELDARLERRKRIAPRTNRGWLAQQGHCVEKQCTVAEETGPTEVGLLHEREKPLRTQGQGAKYGKRRRRSAY